MCLLANIHRNPKTRPNPYVPAEFDPTVIVSPLKPIPLDPDDTRQALRMFFDSIKQ